MSDKNVKLLYLTFGALMLVFLQTSPFQNAIGFTNIIGIPFLGEITFLLIDILSFIGAIIFIIVSFKLLFNNIKVK